MTQKFFAGDLVNVGEMPTFMRHFAGNCKAIVLYTYAEKYGGDARDEKYYCLFVLKKGERGEVAWYMEDQMTFVESDRFDLLPKTNVYRKTWESKKARSCE